MNPLPLRNVPLSKHITTVLVVLILLVCAWQTTPAQDFSIVTNLVTKADQTISQERWTMADSVDIAGRYENDFFLLGQSAQISADFDMDLACAASDITYTGTSKGHVRFAANSIDFNGGAADNVICAATTTEIGPDAKLGANALLVGNAIIVNGTIHGDLKIYASQATLGGTVNGNAKIIAKKITIMPGTTIKGDLRYLMGDDDELFLNDRITIGGECKQLSITELPEQQPGMSLFDQLATQAYFYMNALMIGALIIFIFPRFAANVTMQIKASVLKCFLTGLIALVALPLLAFVFLFSMVGIPVSLLIIFTFGTIVYTSKIFVAYLIGLFIFRKQLAAGGANRFFSILSTGLIIIYALAMIPALSFFIWIITTAIGSGAMILAISRIRHERQVVIKLPDDAQILPDDTPPPPPPPPPSSDDD